MSDFIIQQGTDSFFSWPIKNEDGSAFDPTGWTAKMDVRSRFGKVLHTFSSEAGNLNFGDGVIMAVWSSAETYLWDWTGGRYDLYLKNSDYVLRVDAGYIQVSQAVTKI